MQPTLAVEGRMRFEVPVPVARAASWCGSFAEGMRIDHRQHPSVAFSFTHMSPAGCFTYALLMLIIDNTGTSDVSESLEVA